MLVACALVMLGTQAAVGLFGWRSDLLELQLKTDHAHLLVPASVRQESPALCAAPQADDGADMAQPAKCPVLAFNLPPEPASGSLLADTPASVLAARLWRGTVAPRAPPRRTAGLTGGGRDIQVL